MSQTIEAIVLTGFGGPETLKPRRDAVPPIVARQVRARVHATATNPLVSQIRRGDYVHHILPPAVIEHDISNVVEKVSEGMSEFAVDDEAYYTPKIFGGSTGLYAEQHVSDVDRKPANPPISPTAGPPAYPFRGTVWEAFVSRTRLQIGEVTLVHSGAGGVETIAIQVAKAIGVYVLTTAKSKHHGFLARFGADAAIDHGTEDYIEAVTRIVAGRGVNVVFDTVGGGILSRSPVALALCSYIIFIVNILLHSSLA